MKQRIISSLQKTFGDIARIEDGIIYWSSRKIQPLSKERLRLEERIRVRAKLAKTEKRLSLALDECGIDGNGSAVIRSKGDKALFGGWSTVDMKRRLGVDKSRSLADFLSTAILREKESSASITEFNIRKRGLRSVSLIIDEHAKNNKAVRKVLLDNNIYPERIPSEEDIQNLKELVQSGDFESLKNESALKRTGRGQLCLN